MEQRSAEPAGPALRTAGLTPGLLVVGGSLTFVAATVFVTLPTEIWSVPADAPERLRLIAESRGRWITSNSLFLASACATAVGLVRAVPWLSRRARRRRVLAAVAGSVLGLAAWGLELVARVTVTPWAAAAPGERVQTFEAFDRAGDLGIVLLLGLVGASAVGLGLGMRRDASTLGPWLIALGLASLAGLPPRIPALAFFAPIAIGAAMWRSPDRTVSPGA